MAIKRDAAKPRRKAATPRQQAARAPRPRADPPPSELTKPKRAVRSTSMQLAAEVERLAAELQLTRARIVDLEAKVDIDPLTDLLNRRGFERELTRSVAYVKRYGVSAALIFLDLDDFKPVNDRHGHAAGDAMLKAVAAAIVAEVRASDIVARIGGDEFVVLLWNVNSAAAAAKAAALERVVYATPVQWGTSTLVVCASAGVALAGALDAPGELLARADAAMYARKHARKAERAEQDPPAARPAGNFTQ
jgi:diguanylate cyclase (GGDEF)-like protein